MDIRAKFNAAPWGDYNELQRLREGGVIVEGVGVDPPKKAKWCWKGWTSCSGRWRAKKPGEEGSTRETEDAASSSKESIVDIVEVQEVKWGLSR